MLRSLQKITLLLLFCLVALNLHAQEKCGTDVKHQKMMLSDAKYRQAYQETEKRIQEEILRTKGARTEGTVYKIPVVVHIMHLGEAVGTGTNVSDDQVYSAIASLNNAYRKKAGTIYSANGVDMEMEFCLVKKNPTGGATNGINRINASVNATYATSGMVTDGTANDNEQAIKDLSRWDNNKYYNIWVVSEIDGNNGGSGVQGFAYFPPGGTASWDGAVMLYNSFGYDPEGSRGYNLKSYTNKNITCIHELGHAFGLQHTFKGDDPGNTGAATQCPANNNCSTDGDFVCDTPPHQRSNSNCVSGTNSCDGGSSRELFIHNYMDYSSDDCQNMFTAGQATRARAQLTGGRPTLISASNLTACGCDGSTAPIARFYTLDKQPCEGNPVQFVDETINPGSYNWTFAGGTPATSTSQNPTVSFTGAGPYTVSLQVTSTTGGLTNTATKTNYIAPRAGYSGSLPFTESFESTFPPAGWAVLSNDAATTWGTESTKVWEKRTVSGSTGTGAAAINLFNYNTNIGGFDDLVVPSIDLTGITTPSLSFKVAYRHFDATHADTLLILASTNCGATFTQLYKKGGLDLATTGETASGGPSTATNWRTEPVDLSAFAGQKVQLRFRAMNDYGGNLYIDDVNVNGTAGGPVANFTAAKTTVAVAEAFNFTNSSTGTITTYSWNFGAGATPATASTVGPHSVSYSSAGTKTVTLTVTGPGGTNTATKTNYITVVAAPVADFTASATTTAIGTGINFTNASTGSITTYSWNFGAGATPATASTVGPHSVSYSSAGTKTVTLTVTGPGGTNTATKTNYITVVAAPVANFTASATTTGIGTGINFTNTSTGSITTYSWNFGAGATPATASTVGPHSVSYSSAGTKTVTLTVTGPGGTNTATKTNYITVVAAPVANFTASATTTGIGTGINFTNTSTGSITTYSWNFGAGATPATASTVGPHSVSYSSAGTKTVTLTVTGPGGTNTATKTNYITVVAAPVADFTASKTTQVALGEAISFTNGSTGTLTTYSWNFGAGATPATATAVGPHSVSYNTLGTKTVTLTVTGPGGTNTATKTNYISVVSMATDISVSLESAGIKVYPNPTKDLVYVDMENKEPADIQLLNLSSQVVAEQKQVSGKVEMNIANQPQGVYLLVIKTTQGTSITRITKTN